MTEVEVRAVEARAIEVATAYAVANGYSRGDRTAIGLVLAGMAIAARCSEPIRIALVAGYDEQLASPKLNGWADYLDRAIG